MLNFFEKHLKISWTITIIIAILIFYISAQSFPQGTPGPEFTLKPILYHLTAFFFLNLFLLISITKGKNKKLMVLSMTIAILYEISDEIHQLLVTGRQGTISDVLIDTIGIFISVIIYLPRFKETIKKV